MLVHFWKCFGGEIFGGKIFGGKIFGGKNFGGKTLAGKFYAGKAKSSKIFNEKFLEYQQGELLFVSFFLEQREFFSRILDNRFWRRTLEKKSSFEEKMLENGWRKQPIP